MGDQRYGVIVAAQASVFEAPSSNPGQARTNELLYGEQVQILDERNGWTQIESLHDGYPGFVRTKALQPISELPTPPWRVAVQRTPILCDSDVRAPYIGTMLGFGARIEDGSEQNGFLRIDAGWVFKRHLEPASQCHPSLGECAAKLLGSPYLWGGRGADGVDCSGLVQLACAASGIKAPRDSSQQCTRIGLEVPFTGIQDLRQNDLLFWPGHVAIVHSGQLLHANAWQMATGLEPLKAGLHRVGTVCGKREPTVRRIVS
ncbi:MAG: NlpC/P60 family protein [Pseudomonadota bacterium]